MAEIVNMTNGMYRRLYAGCTRGKRINSVSIFAEVLFWRLHCVADDFGNFSAAPDMVLIDALPRRREFTEADICTGLDELESAQLIKRYTVSGEVYGNILDFLRFQPANKNGKRIQRHPKDSGESGGIQVNPGAAQPPIPIPIPIPTSPPPGESRKPPAPKITSILPPGFLAFWEAWPKHQRKADKMQCCRFWQKNGCESMAETIISAVGMFKKTTDWTKDAGQYIPAPLVWLRKQAWEAPVGAALQKQREMEQDEYCGVTK